jgi:cell wall-associated NlpC family hydrolase
VAVGAVAVTVLVSVLAVVSGQRAGTGPAAGPLRPGAVPPQYAPLVAAAGTRCPEAPPALLAAQLEAESAWNPRARSTAGAQGIAQFMPDTWASWGQDADGDGRRDPWNPADAVVSQAGYDCALADQMRVALQAGRVTGPITDLMLAAYNAGPAAVLAAGGVPAIQETQGYVARITSRAAAFGTGVLGGFGADPGPVGGRTGPPDGAGGLGGRPPAGSFAARLVQIARGTSGTPYAWGGGNVTGPTEGFAQGRGVVGFDCSGLVLYAAYQASGGALRLPRSADQQTRVGTPVPANALQAGDVISFTRPGEASAHHVGIYLGDGLMINSPQTGSVVRVEPLGTGYWKGQSWRAVRYQP